MAEAGIARASAWMALGTMVSRITGFGRLLLIAVAIGTALNADLFNNANTIPNTLYILLAGGVFNVVLVPQLVRAMRADEDGGDAYAQRIITLGLAVLAVGTVVLMLAVPLVMRVVFADRLFDPGNEVQRESAQLMMLLCMPQVFFYGAFVLVGQVLNARRRFGPMMWAPIVNNVVACAVLGLYIAWYGRSNGTDGFTTSEAVLLGAGSTAGIVLQSLVLLPYLRATGFRLRLRLDLRGVGLSRTLRLGAWTLGFIAANQVAYIVVQRLGTSGTLAGAAEGVQAAGTAVYEIGFLVSQLPHGVVTVSLATAVIPTLSALADQGRLDRMREELTATARMALVVIVPLAVALACLGPQAADLLQLSANLAGRTDVIGHTVQAFSLSMVVFTIHYLVLRGFYADEDTRTPFLVQVVVAVVNVVVAVALVHDAEPAQVAARLALAYGLAYVVGAVISVTVLSRRIGTLVDRRMTWFVLRLALASAAAAAAMLGTALALGTTSTAGEALVTLVLAGPAGLAVFVVVALLLRLEELTTVLRRGRAAGPRA